MKKSNSAFDRIWDEIFIRSLKLCINELDEEFKIEAGVCTVDLDRYKKSLKKMYHQKREWLKREYLLNEKNPMLDFHKLSSIVCRCIIGRKPFVFKTNDARDMFNEVANDVSLTQCEKVTWQVDNVYVNYKLAFLVAEGINYIDLLYWSTEKANGLRERYSEQQIDANFERASDKIKIYEEMKRLLEKSHRLYRYPSTEAHDSYEISSIIALMKNDLSKRDFDYLQFSISMYQWQEYTKRQCLYQILRDNNYRLTLKDLA